MVHHHQQLPSSTQTNNATSSLVKLTCTTISVVEGVLLLFVGLSSIVLCSVHSES